jgi:hypothetical protein
MHIEWGSLSGAYDQAQPYQAKPSGKSNQSDVVQDQSEHVGQSLVGCVYVSVGVQNMA